MGSRYPTSSKRRRSTKNYGTGGKGISFSRSIIKGGSTGSARTWPYQRPGLSMVWDPFPAKATAIMRYNTTISLNSDVASIPGYYLFRCNSINDPDATGVGHQPYGHDTYQSIYNHYKVNYATIVVTPITAGTGVIGCSITDDSTVNFGFDNVKETKGTKMMQWFQGTTASKVVQYFNRNQTFGPSVDGVGANFGQNPSEQQYFHVWFTAKDSASTGAVTCNISITYNVSMWELKDLGQS